MKLQSTAFIVGEVERLDGNTKAGSRGANPFSRVACDCEDDDDDLADSGVVSRDDYEALLARAVELAERVKDGRLRKARGTL